MPQAPKWTKVQISGSNFEVNSLTSSVAFDGVDVVNDLAKSVVFRDPTTGGWEATSSIRYESWFNGPYLNVGDNIATHSVNVPDLPISSSIVGQPIPNPEIPLYEYPALFKNSTYGGFEHTSSIYYEGFLGWDGFQRTTNNAYIASGSKLENGNPRETAPFPSAPLLQLQTPFALTFSESFSTQNNVTYLDTDIGDYIEWDLGLPVGYGITASFNIPVIFSGSYSAPASRDFVVTLRRWLPGGYSNSAPEYLDTSLTLELQDIIPISNPQYGSIPATGSASGSFEIDSTAFNPIAVGERWQLRVDSGTDSGWVIGYLGSYSFDIGPFEFVITGSTAPPTDIFSGNFSGSFIGDMYGGASGSLTGITLNEIPPTDGLQRGDGLIFIENDGTATATFVGDAETTASIRLYPMNVQGSSLGAVNKSGLEISGLSDSFLFGGNFDLGSLAGGLQLATNLPGTGLEYDGDRNTISINFATNAGLSHDGGQLIVANTLDGDGLEGGFGSGQPGSMSIELHAGVPGNSGLAFGEAPTADADALSLDSGLPGYGLLWTGLIGDYTELAINTNQTVTSSGYISFNTVASPQTLAVNNTWPGGLFYNNVNVTYDNNATTQQGTLGFEGDGFVGQGNSTPIISKNIEITGSVLVKGNFTVVENSNVTSIWAQSFETTDQFVRLNSGSVTAPFTKDNAGLIIQDEPLDGGGNASGSAIFGDFGTLGDNLTIGSKTFIRRGWGVTKGRVPWDATTPFDNFSAQADVGDLTSSVDYISALATNKWGTGAPTDTDSYFIDNDTLGQTVGSFWVDTSVDPSGNDSNVYIFGLFE